MSGGKSVLEKAAFCCRPHCPPTAALSRHALNAWRLLVLLGIVVATALWAVSNIKNSSRIDGPQGRGYSGSRADGFCFDREQVGSGEKWPIMSPHIRIREEVGRVTACPEQSRMGARRRPNANKPSPLATFVRRAPDPSGPALPTLRRARSSRHRFRLFPQNHQLTAA